MRAAVLALALLAVPTAAPAESLGHIDFPVTGSAASRERFVRGVMALHSFFYDEALEELRAATREDPGFAMGYWGEAMALNETLWQRQDTEGGRKALAKIPADARLTPREQGLVAAARVLYGDGDKRARDDAYLAAMARLSERFPDDLELRALHALALLGVLRDDEPGLATRMRAGAIALDVLAKNPDHPGAAHYVIHAFDDADHAVLALPAARRYAQIAPAAYHARHMPAHIFVNLGMWDEAAAACESAWAASTAWAERRHHGIEKRDYHSLEWLVAIYRQQGRLKKAQETLELWAAAARDSTDARVDTGFAWATGLYLLHTGGLARLEPALAAIGKSGGEGGGQGPGCHATSTSNAGDGDPAARVELALARQRALAAATRGDAAALARQNATATAAVEKLASATYGPELARGDRRYRDELAARLAMGRKRWAEAETRLRALIAASRDQPFRGAADPSGNALETLLGDALLAHGKAKEAAAAYAEALRVTPGDALTLLGAARAARALGDAAGAASHYQTLLAQWAHADPDLPELAEVRAGAHLVAGGPRPIH